MEDNDVTVLKYAPFKCPDGFFRWSFEGVTSHRPPMFESPNIYLGELVERFSLCRGECGPDEECWIRCNLYSRYFIYSDIYEQIFKNISFYIEKHFYISKGRILDRNLLHVTFRYPFIDSDSMSRSFVFDLAYHDHSYIYESNNFKFFSPHDCDSILFVYFSYLDLISDFRYPSSFKSHDMTKVNFSNEQELNEHLEYVRGYIDKRFKKWFTNRTPPPPPVKNSPFRKGL